MVRSVEIRIGTLARLTGCNIETIRYYERVGLLPPPARSTSRYGLYDADDVRRWFLCEGRASWASHSITCALLALSADRGGSNTCAQV
jgi:MerR family mercuric resistance operon transcriptional regulator